jgi:diguanylate cyclase (GGDEF)-like protein
VATLNFDFAPYAQILRSLMPRARSIYLYAPGAELLWSSEGADWFDLRPPIIELLEQAQQPEHLDRSGYLRMIDETPAYCFLLRDELGGVLGALGVLARPATRAGDVAPFDNVERTLASLLGLARRELAQQRLKVDTGRFDLSDTQELQWLLDVTHIEAPRGGRVDSLQALMDAFAERCECDVALLHVPGRRLERTASRLPLARSELDLLRGLVGRHLFRVAQLQQKTLIVNKVREAGAGGLVPFRILCVPLLRRGQVDGVAVAFNRAQGRPFESRDARMLERLGPRLQEIIDVDYDDATGLLTRHAFEESAAALLARDASVPRAIVYADVDQLHVVNDLFGFGAGDDVLKAVGATWRAQPLPPGSLAARIAGDRFVVLLEDCTQNRARAWADAARAAIEAVAPPERCAGLRVSASLGVAPVDANRTLEHALVAAQTACKAAKDRGRNRVEDFAATDASLLQRHDELRMYRELVDAFEQGRFQLYAQAIVPLWDPTRAVRYEVFVRMLDTRGQPVAPERFLSAAGRYQLLDRLDRWVLDEVFARLAPHAAALADIDTVFSVNVSAQSLGSPEYLERVRAAIDAHRLQPSLLAFEVAEAAAIGRFAEAEVFLAGANALGCHTAIDDFGTGVSSLAYLKSLPVAALKIDGVFVRDLLSNPRSESMVRAILQIARQLELETIAEAVESREIAVQLATLGVTYGQGYAFAQPRPFAEVLAELVARHATTPAGATRPAGELGGPVH